MLVKSETIERLRSSVNATQADWSAMLEIPMRSYALAVSTPEVAISEKVLENLAIALEIAPETILNGTVDFRLLAKRASGHATALPEKYSSAAYSKVRTSAYLLDYVEMNYGWQVRNRILRQFQMSESIISDPDMQISIRFLAELCEHLRSQGFASSGFYEIGKYSSVINSNSALADIFRQEGTPSAAYERCFTDLIQKYYDQNNVYTLQTLGPHHCVVTARPHPRLLDESHGNSISNASICMAKAGGFASIMEYLGLPDAKVKETRCIHRGDAECRFEIDFEFAMSSFLQNSKRPLTPSINQ